MNELYKQKLLSIVSKAKQIHKYPAKTIILSELLRDLFNVDLEEILPGIERGLKNKILGLRGSIDLLYAGVIFEIKVNLEKEIEDAKSQLKKYFQILLEKEPNKKYIGIATDVIKFKAYKPVVFNGKVIGIEKIDEIDLTKSPTADAIIWLDSYIFSTPQIRPSAIDLKFRYGIGSPTYSLVKDEVTQLWEKVKDEKETYLKYEL